MKNNNRYFEKNSPAGLNARTDKELVDTYFLLKDTRNQARNIERQIQMGDEELSTSTHWETVKKLSNKLLLKTKDIEIIVWHIEATIRLNGLEGLLNGFNILHELITDFWDVLFPMPDEEGINTRVLPLAGLNGIDSEGSLIEPIRQLPITNSSTSDNFLLWQYIQALSMKKNSILLKRIQQSANESSTSFYQNINTLTKQCLKIYIKINYHLHKKCGKQSPPSNYIKREFINLIKHIENLSSKQHDTATPTETIKNNMTTAPMHSNTLKNLTHTIKDRHHALTMLAQVVIFFKKTEPHSPIPYLIDRTIKWGNLSFPKLLEEMIVDKHALLSTFNLTGVPHSEISKKNNITSSASNARKQDISKNEFQ